MTIKLSDLEVADVSFTDSSSVVDSDCHGNKGEDENADCKGTSSRQSKRPYPASNSSYYLCFVEILMWVSIAIGITLLMYFAILAFFLVFGSHFVAVGLFEIPARKRLFEAYRKKRKKVPVRLVDKKINTDGDGIENLWLTYQIDDPNDTSKVVEQTFTCNVGAQPATHFYYLEEQGIEYAIENPSVLQKDRFLCGLTRGGQVFFLVLGLASWFGVGMAFMRLVQAIQDSPPTIDWKLWAVGISLQLPFFLCYSVLAWNHRHELTTCTALWSAPQHGRKPEILVEA